MSESDTDVGAELMPGDDENEGLDAISYIEGCLAAVLTLGLYQWLGHSPGTNELLAIGGVGMAAAIVWEVKYGG